MSWIEILGFITGAVSVILAVRENAWNWIVGIANNIFFFVLFWHTKLYADALLQIVYAGISVYGWWHWVRGGKGNSALPISRIQWQTALSLLLVTGLSTALMTYLLGAFTDSKVPFWDGLTTALSLTAQFMLSRKLLENWWVWMTADVVYVLLYWYKALYLTGILYAGFFALCVLGFIGWRRTVRSAVLERAVVQG
ncbi:MAG: nicotinamide mononucleotide transporter [Acidobacteria bacterium]|nr:nicotinamide mononucleotide transporter [Acidobacteriota bacterium]